MEQCSNLPQLEYGEFSEALHKRVGSQHIPISGSLEVTSRCNLRCQHCYIPIENRRKARDVDLSKTDLERILDEVTDAGCLWLLLTGGEPFLRRDFLDIYIYAKRKGLILTIFTNGTLITPRIADYLAEWRPFNMEITLYGATQETYELVTGIPGSYSRCRRGIDLLLDRRLPLSLKTMVMTINKNELDQMKALATSLSVEFRFDPIVQPALDGSNRPNLLRLAPQEIVEIEKADQDRSKRWPESYQQNQGNTVTERAMYLCGAGKKSFYIDAAGRLYACMDARQISYDLRMGKFEEGWEKISTQVTSLLHTPDFPCLECELRLLCAQCPAMAELEYGESERRVEFLCQLARLRKLAFSETK